MTGLRSEKEAGNLLSTYLLQGWIMTDEICPIESCSYPLMRSKDGSLSFCTLHDPLPNHGATHNYKSQSLTKQEQPVKQQPLVEDAATLRQRREQSSKASQLIGQKMLQRWALLNEHCPNDSCYAIPLIRNPETKQMYCVICENYILSEEEALELENKKQKSAPEPQPAQPKIEQQEENTKPIHSPIQTVYEERKRQKVDQEVTFTAGVFTSNVVVSTLSNKMNELSEKVKSCHDPKELVHLFKAIKECADAIKACVEAGEVYDKSL